MKKLTIISLIIGLLHLSACKKNNNVSDIEQQIAKYKQQIAELNLKINQLQSQLNDSSIASDQTVYVDTIHIKTEKYQHFVQISGQAIAEEDIIITPETNGQIKKIYVKEGQYVKKGQLLVKLKDDILQSKLAQLETQLLFADTLFEKQKILYQKKLISEAQYLQTKNQRDVLLKNIESLKTQIKMSNIYAPFSGIIDQIFAKEGQMAAPSMRILELVNLNSLYAQANISEKYIPIINIGDPIIIKIPLYKNLQENTKISWISNVIDPNSRTIKIKATIKNKDKKIKPNMAVIIKFCDYQKYNAIVIPTNAMIKDLNGWFVYKVQKKNNKLLAQKQYITVEYSDNNKTVVKQGLKVNDAIITNGNTLVRNNSQIIIKQK